MVNYVVKTQLILLIYLKKNESLAIAIKPTRMDVWTFASNFAIASFIRNIYARIEDVISRANKSG